MHQTNDLLVLMTAESVIRSVSIMDHDFQKKQQPRCAPSSRTKQIWCPPASNQVKINFDGAFSPTTKKGAWSFLARDQTGEVVLAGAGNMGLACDALMVEATTCLRALELADQFGISHIQLETDSTQLEEAIRFQGSKSKQQHFQSDPGATSTSFCCFEF